MRIQLPDFSLAKVLICGDVMLDRYWQGTTSRISPEAPVPVVHVKGADDRPGGAGNVALNVASMGATVQLFAPCGDDEAGQILERTLQSAGIISHLAVSAERPTVMKLRILSVNQQLLRLDFEDIAEQDHSALQNDCVTHLDRANVLILSDYGKGALNDPQPLIQAAAKLNKPVIVDPKGADFSKYRGASIITPNFKEFQDVVGECVDEDAILERGLNLINQQELTALLVTRGARGMMLIQPGEPAVHLPARSNEVFDVTGAGDTVVAVLAASIGAGASFADGTRLANIAAGQVVSKLGAAQITSEEMSQCLEDEGRHHAAVVDQAELQRCFQMALDNDETVTIIQGDFDCISVQDLRLLDAAKAQGERLLIVTPNQAQSDEIHSIVRRHRVLGGLKAVDWIFSCAKGQFETILELVYPQSLSVDANSDYPIENKDFSWIIYNGGKLRRFNGFWTSHIEPVVDNVLKSEEAII